MWCNPKVPLAHRAGNVTCRLQNIRYRHLCQRQPNLLSQTSGRRTGVELVAETLLVTPRRQAGACRAAHRTRNVAVRKTALTITIMFGRLFCARLTWPKVAQPPATDIVPAEAAARPIVLRNSLLVRFSIYLCLLSYSIPACYERGRMFVVRHPQLNSRDAGNEFHIRLQFGGPNVLFCI